MSLATEINRDLERETPALHRALSSLGREAAFPPDIPFQAKEARGTELNGTIGIFTDGRGGAVPLPSVARSLNLEKEEMTRAILYSPVVGHRELRELWRERQHRLIGGAPVTSLPVVTGGLSHSLSMIADLFSCPGRAVAIPSPFWGNYRQTFGMRTGARLATAPAYVDGRYNPRAIAQALADLPPGEPALAILNFPSNPGGYSPTVEERQALRESLVEVARERPLVVASDDAYSGFVYAEGVPSHSIFWDLVGAHEQLIPIKVDGATKELSFFGGRVGFLTFAVDPESAAAAALESKVASLSRSTIGSPSSSSQTILIQALKSDALEAEVREVFEIAKGRYERVLPALEAIDRSLLDLMPFNSGFFVLMEIREELGVDSNTLRRHLIEHHSTGIVSIKDRYVRLATCSVAADGLPEMVARIQRGLRELAGISA